MNFSIFNQPSDIYGKASFMRGLELWNFLSRKNDGLVMDGKRRISQRSSFQNCAVVAPPGVGKTTRFIVPNVLTINGPSMVITDPSGEIHSLCQKHLKSIGYDVHVLSVDQPKLFDQYNPLINCTKPEDYDVLAQIIVQSQVGGSGDPYWTESAQSIVGLCLQCADKFQVKPMRTLYQAYELIQLLLIDPQQVDSLMQLHLSPRYYADFKAFMNEPEKTRGSVLATAKTSMYKLRNQNVIDLTSSNTLDFHGLRTGKTAVFIIVPEHKIGYYSFLLVMFFTQLFEVCAIMPTPGKDRPIFFLLDEFGNMGHIPDFDKLINTLRKRRCSLSLVLQDYQQVTALYGQDAASIILLSGCASHIIYPGCAPHICSSISDALGQRTVINRRQDPANWELVSQSRYFDEIGRPLMTSDEIRMMKQDQALLIHSNRKPVLMRTTPWFENKQLKKRTR